MTSPFWAKQGVDKAYWPDRKRNRRHYFNSFKNFPKIDVDVEDLSISALIRLIEENPSSYGVTIILDNKRMQIGFFNEDLNSGLLLSRSYRKR